MKIAFTGHRDSSVIPEALAEIAALFPGATWIHGGARGFDRQVADYARTHGIQQIVIRPDYARYSKSAPLVRDREIVDSAECLFACYDGRQTGGTFYTMN